MTTIKVSHAMGTYTGHISHHDEQTVLSIDFGECAATMVQVARTTEGTFQAVRMELPVGKAQKGMPLLLKALAEQWVKPEGPVPIIGNVEFINESGQEKPRDARAEKGLAGEEALNDWLRGAGLSYLYVNQTPETFANLFQGRLKRPDFLVLLESIGLIAVDAKNYKCENNEYTLRLKTELQRVLTFERLFRIPVWYAYMGEQSGTSTVWYWISALKALEVGKVRRRRDNDEEYVSIDRRHFERIERNEDLGKLYTHRLPSLRQISTAKASLSKKA